jgi:uncharacterized protein YuzE
LFGNWPKVIAGSPIVARRGNKVYLESSIRYDRDRDILAMCFENGAIGKTINLFPGIEADYDPEGRMVGLRISRASGILEQSTIAHLLTRQAGIIG